MPSLGDPRLAGQAEVEWLDRVSALLHISWLHDFGTPENSDDKRGPHHTAHGDADVGQNYDYGDIDGGV